MTKSRKTRDNSLRQGQIRVTSYLLKAISILWVRTRTRSQSVRILPRGVDQTIQHIEFNTKKRTEAKIDFEKDFYKILNVSLFGKLVENQKRQREIFLVCTEKKLKKIDSQANLPFKEDIQ